MKWRAGTLWAVAVSSAMLSLAAPYVAADAPLLVDDDRIDSANHAFFAVPSPDHRLTVVFRRGKGRPDAQEWSMPGWSVVGFLSDDGDYLVTGYPGVNILALDHKADDVILSIRRRGRLVRAVRLNALLRDLRSLGPRSESGFSWGEYEGFVAAHRFAVSTVEHRRIVFDVETGNEVGATQTRAADPPRGNGRPH